MRYRFWEGRVSFRPQTTDGKRESRFKVTPGIAMKGPEGPKPEVVPIIPRRSATQSRVNGNVTHGMEEVKHGKAARS